MESPKEQENQANDAPKTAQTPEQSEAPKEPVEGGKLKPGIVVPQKKRKMKLIAVVLAALLIIGSLAFSFYYFVMRVPDAVYAQANGYVSKMSDGVKKISEKTSDWNFLDSEEAFNTARADTSVTDSNVIARMAADTESTEDTVKKISEIKKLFEDYSNAASDLKASAVMRDPVVSAKFTKVEKLLDGYRDGFSKIIDTSEVLVSFLIDCTEIEWNKIKSLGDYDKLTKDCFEFIKQNPSVPLKDYSETVYAPLAKLYKSFLEIYRDLFEAIDTNNEIAYTSAVTALTIVAEDIQELQQSTGDYKLDMPEKPTKQLNELKTLVNQRKSLFFR